MLENTFQPINNGIGPMMEKEKRAACMLIGLGVAVATMMHCVLIN